MNIGQAETQVIIALLVSLAAIIPTAGIAVRAYLQAQTNKWQLEDRPTHEEVRNAVSKAVEDAISNNGN